ncbi:hypothetical protein VSH64_14355 [Amycolatopsis rhabdoformis]|uniref:Carboxymuconolactone decarboxylase family protein n=1 Tax=Amycolatopsis rhabdoformis TaxID=1448059 RepID=A0ABZ1IGP0_9PSEU|nr:hypothetical protein [Amycolatopsis rhabdoformis]WSE33283.1 hypothetical protein VSH64_14355 [Amycolatopsis rhabdoformis]
MRLSILEHGHRRRAKLFLSATAKMSRVDSPDIVLTLLYRPEYLTRALLDLTAPAMRGPSYWTAGEREYLAMGTAKLHECPFCIVTHAELTRIAGTGEVDPDEPAAARPELRAVRAFLDTVSRPGSEPDAALIADVPAAAVLDALRVNLVWDVVNRLANAFGFELRDGQLESGTRSLHRFGYRFPGFLLSGGPKTDHGDVVENLRHAVTDARGVTDPALRAALMEGTPVPEPWSTYADTVRTASYRLTDADFAALRAAGHSEDEIFEVTLAAAAGAALHAYDRGRKAVGQ